MEELQDLFNAWNGEHITYCPFIYCPIVLHWIKAPIFLLDEEPRARPWRVGQFNVPQLQILSNELLGGLLLILIQCEDLAVDRRGCTLPQDNSMILRL
jgi:hypothetical protein